MKKFVVLAMVATILAMIGCGASGRSDGPNFQTCTPGESSTCTCAGGQPGSQVCNPDGMSNAACNCPQQTPVACGDGICQPTESCSTCAKDCGECPKCEYAPSCKDAVGVPATTTPRPDLDITDHPVTTKDGGADGGATPVVHSSVCQTPQLRMRLQKIQTRSGGATIYCVVNASDGATSEVTITTKTSDMKDGDTYYFDPTVGVFWGQKELHPSPNNITVTYNCFKVNSDSWSKVLKAAGDAAAQAGGYAGPYGWAFGLGAVGADVAAAAVQATSGDDLILNSQQVIDKKTLLDLTNDRSWLIRKSHDGGFLGYSWDWELDVESWGCADGASAPK